MATITRKHWIIGGAVVVGVLLLVSEQDRQTGGGIRGTGSLGPCTVTVTADSLNVRSLPDDGASVVQIYGKGAVVSADRAISNGFRQLGPGRWAARDFLDPTPGSDCG
ncbi:MAG: SH3 domain-containing protein [Pseudonocardiaceae bacterium]